ncbi:hypothetical protein OG689_27945 [Kitasatospora sp. NBC_00240]|uniref:hypothetical protein n=1 Tax=Kitasatospora sp. NBC_00240 TaxID=2903567 RepID=UPI00225339FA|nr:hypothetical protein [Kitasatospora sp. NBC_00240]MCX5213058.1 hypothetical protein [Kitasatospora sp. NBC_00240]
MSQDGKDAKQPTMEKKDSQDWARQMTEYMAQAAGVQLNLASINPYFSRCVGKNDELADDDRYTLTYYVDTTVPVAQHPDAVRKIREMLEGRGLDVESYREYVDGKPEALLYARQPTSRYLVSASTSGGSDRMLFTVGTPCLMPGTPSPSAAPS